MGETNVHELLFLFFFPEACVSFLQVHIVFSAYYMKAVGAPEHEIQKAMELLNKCKQHFLSRSLPLADTVFLTFYGFVFL